MAKILGDDGTAPSVLRFGHDYIHCGEPMQDAGRDIYRGLPDVTVPTRILRCRCGFRLAVPN
ncbi:hypothetical protein [Specibacter cremeus]|uniref:hypothetical protein n=1 Tax=Specibacter cremeus TaxID=1629051 RepID=UPI000F77C4E3|nr:hypothetical protein [Specibacter cremeus]